MEPDKIFSNLYDLISELSDERMVRAVFGDRLDAAQVHLEELEEILTENSYAEKKKVLLEYADKLESALQDLVYEIDSE